MHSFETETIYWLVVISIVTSITASYSAFSFAARAYDLRGALARPWLAGGALAMGAGTCCMHYLAMFSTPLSVPVYYHVPTVALALAMAVGASQLAFAMVRHQFGIRPAGMPIDKVRVAAAGIVLGLGIAGMHFLGMASMRWGWHFTYSPGLVAVSILLSVISAWAGLWISFAVPPKRLGREWSRLLGALVIGLGTVDVHYVIRGAMTILPGEAAYSTLHSIRITSLTIVSAFMTIGLVLFGALFTAVLDRRNYVRMQATNRRLRRMRARLRRSESALREANTRLTELSMRDGLTGVHNRRHFEDALDAEWRRARRAREQLAVLLIDIDHFKILNDTFGHRAGDECLRQVALCLKQNLHRSGDTLARYGGEEFIAILPGVDTDGAVSVAESMRLAIESLTVRLTGVAGPPRITVSIGACSHVPSLDEVPGSLVVAADEALYRAKFAGRNCVRQAEAGAEVSIL